jgi:hypothetical protein
MKRVIFLIVLLALVVIGFIATGQTKKSDIVTDRPDQTESPVVLPKGSLQVETGFMFEQNREQQVEENNIAFSTTLIKYGVNDHFELRLITEFLGSSIEGTETPTMKTSGFSPIAVGVKIKLADENGFWPQAALIGHINLKTGHEEFMPEHTAADFRFTFAHTLSEKWSLSYNVGAEWDGVSPEAIFLYTLSLAYSFTDKVGAYAEGYSFFPEAGKADNRIDGGITYKITPVIQLDASGGIGLSENAPDYFVSAGCSFRLFK